MKSIASWLLIIAFTFTLGVVTTLLYLKLSASAAQNPEAPSSIPIKENVSSDLPILAYCELANNPEKYDGKIVRVSARLWFMMHGYSFLNKNCDGVTKQTVVIFADVRGLEIENKIAMDIGLREYNPWSFPEIIAVGKFSRVEPSRKSDSMEDNAYLHFEILDIEKASKY